MVLAGVVLSILPGPLPTALAEFANKVDWQTLFPFTDLRDVHTQGVTCDCSPEEALQALLENTHIQYRKTLGKHTTVSFTRDDSEGETPTWYTEGGYSYGCQPMSAFSGFTFSVVDRYVIRLGLADISTAMLCYPNHPTEAYEEVEVTVEDVVVQSRRRSHGSVGRGPRW